MRIEGISSSSPLEDSIDTVATPALQDQRRSGRLHQVQHVDYAEEENDDELPVLLSGSLWNKEHLDRLGVDFPAARIDLDDILKVKEEDFDTETKRCSLWSASWKLTSRVR